MTCSQIAHQYLGKEPGNMITLCEVPEGKEPGEVIDAQYIAEFLQFNNPYEAAYAAYAWAFFLEEGKL